MKRERSRRGVRGAVAGAAALLLAGATVAGVSLAGERAGAAPNPVGDRSSTATITLAAQDGSYRVDYIVSADLLDDTYGLTFDLAFHDGFRAPDDDQPGPPPYLRPEYTLTEATFDGASTADDFTREGHLLSLELGGEVAEGEHEGRVTYTVAGAALPTDDGYDVYVRTGDLPGNERLVIDGSALTDAEVTGVQCQYQPIPEPCGERRDAERWHLRDGSAEVIIIAVDGPSDALLEPTIDRE